MRAEGRESLVGGSGRSRSAQALALRSRIVLGWAEGLSNKEVAAREGVAAVTVGKWRVRFVESRLDGVVAATVGGVACSSRSRHQCWPYPTVHRGSGVTATY